MTQEKERAIREIVDNSVKKFASSLESKHLAERNNPTGAINKKANNAFIKELSPEFMFYSALMRSFDSSLGGVLEGMGREIAALSYKVYGTIESFILPAQLNKIQEIMDSYGTDAQGRIKPEVAHYANFSCIVPRNIDSFYRLHHTDNCFYNPTLHEYYVIELKAGGDLDNKKALAEKKEILIEYFLLKNKVESDAKVKLFFGTAYNKDGEGNEWKQASVRNVFAPEELLIGKDYWDFVCDDKDGYNVVIDQYKQSAHYVSEAIQSIKNAYIN